MGSMIDWMMYRLVGIKMAQDTKFDTQTKTKQKNNKLIYTFITY